MSVTTAVLTPEATAAEPQSRLPWPALAIALVALLAFALCLGSAWLSTTLAIAILGSYATDARLKKGALPMRAVRLLVMGAQVLLRLAETDRQGTFAYIDLYIGLFGQLTATEMALQFWQSPPYGGHGGAVIASLSGLVFVAAAKTEARTVIPWITPLYFVLLMIALHRTRHPPGSGSMRRVLPALAAVVLVLGIGLGTSTAIWSWHNDLTYWFTKVMAPLGKSEGSGISQIPVLGPTSNLHLSPARALRLDGALNEPYLRGLAYDTYGHGVWGPPLDVRHFDTMAAPDLVKGAVRNRVKITRLTDDTRLLVAPLHCSGVVLSKRSMELAMGDGGPLRSALWLAAPSAHDVLLSGDDEWQGPLCQPPNEDYRRRCLVVPKDVDPKVITLSQSIVAGLPTPRERADAIIDYLKTHNAYSLTTDPGTGDPVSNFILKQKAAHCEYFASAAVLMLRAAKLPARYVTGYSAFSAIGKVQAIIRQRDAHAWAECWIDGTGWITLDATPESSRPNEDVDAVPWLTRFSEWLEDTWTDIRDWMADISVTNLMTGILSLLVLVVGLQWLRAFRARSKTRPVIFAYASPGAELAALSDKFERLLRTHQVPCPAHRTWLEHLRVLTKTHPTLPFKTEAAAAFAQHYADVRFGAPESREAVAELSKEFHALT